LDAAAAQARYDALLASPVRLIAFHALFILACGAVVMRGVGAGIDGRALGGRSGQRDKAQKVSRQSLGLLRRVTGPNKVLLQWLRRLWLQVL
jgi:hypothetical protein